MVIVRVLLFGDNKGISQLLRHVPNECVCGVVAASNRPQYHSELEKICLEVGVSFFIHPLPNSHDYRTFIDELIAVQADLILCSSYSQMIRSEILATCLRGAFNVHYSLLPRNRGCHPIQWAILNGQQTTGVTVHQMTEGFDEGPILGQIEVPILLSDSWISLLKKLDLAADKLLSTSVTKLLSNQLLTLSPQQSNKWPYGRRRSESDSEIRWDDPLICIFNHIRALLPPCPPAFVAGANGMIFDRLFTLQEVYELKWLNADSSRQVSEGFILAPFQTGTTRNGDVSRTPAHQMFRSGGKSVRARGTNPDEDAKDHRLVLQVLSCEGGPLVATVIIREIQQEAGICEVEIRKSMLIAIHNRQISEIREIVRRFVKSELQLDRCLIEVVV